MSARPEIAPFADEHLAEASVLLAARHARHRLVEPLLSAAFEKPDAAARSWRPPGVRKVPRVPPRSTAAVSSGYLVGAPRRGSTWGPNIWVEPAGHAAEEAETVRDLYAHAAAAWVAAGATRHYAVVPAHDPALLDAWSRLEFGQQQGLGIREVPRQPGEPGRARVRLATADDVDEILRLDILGEYQTSSPTFAVHVAPDPEEAREELLEELADPRVASLIAELDGRAVGIATAAPAEYSGLHTGVARPDDACILGYAATVPEVRGSGAGVALTEGVFAWARENGYTTVVVDWRVPNLLSSRFWPARGFRTSFVRLHRAIA